MTATKITEFVDGKGNPIELPEGFFRIMLGPRIEDRALPENITVTRSWDDVEISGPYGNE